MHKNHLFLPTECYIHLNGRVWVGSSTLSPLKPKNELIFPLLSWDETEFDIERSCETVTRRVRRGDTGKRHLKVSSQVRRTPARCTLSQQDLVVFNYFSKFLNLGLHSGMSSCYNSLVRTYYFLTFSLPFIGF